VSVREYTSEFDMRDEVGVNPYMGTVVSIRDRCPEGIGVNVGL